MISSTVGWYIWERRVTIKSGLVGVLYMTKILVTVLQDPEWLLNLKASFNFVDYSFDDKYDFFSS